MISPGLFRKKLTQKLETTGEVNQSKTKKKVVYSNRHTKMFEYSTKNYCCEHAFVSKAQER